VSIVTLIFRYFIVYVSFVDGRENKVQKVGHLYLEKEKSVGSSFFKLPGKLKVEGGS